MFSMWLQEALWDRMEYTQGRYFFNFMCCDFAFLHTWESLAFYMYLTRSMASVPWHKRLSHSGPSLYSREKFAMTSATYGSLGRKMLCHAGAMRPSLSTAVHNVCQGLLLWVGVQGQMLCHNSFPIIAEKRCRRYSQVSRTMPPPSGGRRKLCWDYRNVGPASV